MRKWHVETSKSSNTPTWLVVRQDGKVYSYCDTQAMAANVCCALNEQELLVWEATMKDRGV